MTPPFELAMLALYFGAVLALVGLMVVLSYGLGPRSESRAMVQPFESGMLPVGDARLKFPAQFYLIAMIFVVFDLEAVFIYAWAVAARRVGWSGYTEVMVFIAILVAALAYLWRVGALDWTPPRSRRAPRRLAPRALEPGGSSRSESGESGGTGAESGRS